MKRAFCGRLKGFVPDQMSEKIRVLVTGATGFVGKHLVRALEEEGPSVFEIFGTAYPDVPLPSVPRLFFLDLRSEKDVMGLVEEIHPSWIFHLAAVSNVHRSWEMRGETIETNILGTQNLVEAVRRAAPGSRVLFVSSSEVYGVAASSAEALDEEAPLQAVSPYAYSKAAGEMLCRFYEKVEKVDIVIARPFPHTGPGQSKDFVCSDWARQVALIEIGDSVPVLRVGNLDLCRDFSDVRDVVRAYVLLLKKGRRGGVYNVCSGRAVPLRKILNLLTNEASKHAPISVEVDAGKLRKIDVPCQLGSCKKISKETGWSPGISIDQTLRDLLDYWRQRVRDFP